MSTQNVRNLHSIEGRRVSVSLRDGRRLDDCSLISAGRARVRKFWLFSNGEDVFVPFDDVIDVWEADPPQAA